jgi:membrane protein
MAVAREAAGGAEVDQARREADVDESATTGSKSQAAPSPAVQAQRRFGVWRQLRAVFTMSPSRLGSVFVEAYSNWLADGATRLGASLAFYTLFSIAPLLIVITGIVGIFVDRAAARAEISTWLQRFLSQEGARAAELMLERRVTATGGFITTVIGLLTLFLATSALVNELRQSVNLVWRVPAPPTQGFLRAARGMLTDRLYAFLVAVGAALLVIVSLAFNASIAIAASSFHALPLPALVLHVLNFATSVFIMSVVFTLVYKALPDAYVAWGDAWVGALATALLFETGSLILSMFVRQAADSPYGTAASVLALLVWVYYSAQVFFFGAELTRIFATTYGGGIIPVQRSLRRALLRRPRERGSTKADLIHHSTPGHAARRS